MSSVSLSKLTELETFRVTGDSGDTYVVAGEPIGGDQRSRWFRCHDQHGRERVFKQYRGPVTDPEAIGWAAQTVQFGRGIVLAAEQQPNAPRAAANSINWPIDAIRGDRTLAGVILPPIPAEFLQPDGSPLTLDHLYSQHPPEAYYRVRVLIRVCEILATLDEWAVVHGDISPRTLIWQRTHPHAYLLECDGIRPAHASAAQESGPGGVQPGQGTASRDSGTQESDTVRISQGTTTRGPGTGGDVTGGRDAVRGEGYDPRWSTGRITAPDRYSDRFGLAALLYRGLLLNDDVPTLEHGDWQPPSGIPVDLDPGLRALFERAFTDPFATDARPTAAEWLAALTSAFLALDGTFYREDALAVLDRHTQRFRAGSTLPPTVPGAPQAQEPPSSDPIPPSGPIRPEGFGVPPIPPAPPNNPHHGSPGRTAAIVVACVALLAIIALVAYRTDNSEDSDSASSSTYTTSSSYYTAPTTPAFNWDSLNTEATDKTPFTTNALLPQSFRDSKNVEYTLRGAGVHDCFSGYMTDNVRQILTDYHCAQSVTGSYVDHSDQILVAVNIYAFPTSAEARRFYDTINGQPQDWVIYCPQNGPGATVCDQFTGNANRSGWGSTNYRYVYKSTALYINLTRDASATEWLDPAAREAVVKVGPENYWPK
ncbi:hypothetical protein AB0N05_33880 [Nocardia sp. NPDC051030]|uniref:hypothetical protein n=1 Tax=Nocardia sp. NPDC051030 TaxID=3155162 RepID=UPI00341653C2